MQENDLPSLPFTGRDEASIKAALIAFVQATYASVQSDFTEATLGMMLLDMVSQEGGLGSYGLDAAASEFYLSTCRRRESAIRWANSVGYAVTSAKAAELTVKSTSVPNALIINGGTFPALTTFLTTASGLRFELQEDLVVPTGIAIIRMDLLEGQTYTETFNPANVTNQIITGSQSIVQDGSWIVYVGAVSDMNQWTQVANVTLEPSATNTYDVTIDGSGRVNVRFGDGVAGAIPGATITLIYRTTDGAAGNIPAGALQGSLACTLASSAGTASVPFENYDLQQDGSIVGAATGGAAQESLQQLKTNIPAYIRAPISIVTLQDYDTSLLRLSVVALTVTQRWVSSYTGNIVRINAWSDVDTEFTSTCTAPAITATVPYTEYTQVQPTAIASIQAFLAPLTMLTVHNVITLPSMLWLDVFLGAVTYDPTYTPQQVLNNITTSIVNLFETGSGLALYLSELYNAVRNTAGVLYFNLQRISTGFQESSAEAQGSTAASATQSGALQVTPVLGGTVSITFQQDAGNVVIEDDGAGHLTLVTGNAGITSIVTSSLNYQTGAWSVQFNAALQGGKGILADYQDLVDDYRLQQIPVTDPWPAPQGAFIRVIESEGNTVASATQTGTFVHPPIVAGQVMLTFTTNVGAFTLLDDGAGNLVLSVAPAGYTLSVGTVNYTSGAWSFTLNTALSAGYAITGAYRQSGLYPPLQDIVINATDHVPYYYDDTLMFNDEVFYDSVSSNLNPDLLALNLRTLNLSLVAGTSP